MTTQPNSGDLEKELVKTLTESSLATAGRTVGLIAQVVAVAETIKGLQRDLDDLSAEFNQRIGEIRKRIGGKP